MDKWKKLYFLLFLLGLTGMLLVTYRAPLSDYGNYYYGSKFLAEGKFSASVYDPWTFNEMIRAENQTGLYENYTPVPPFSLVVYLPFVFFNPLLSKFLFSLFSLLVLFFVLYHGRKKGVPVNETILWPLLLITAYANFVTGQSYLLLAACLLQGWFFYSERKLVAAALLWAFAIHLKILPGIIFLFLVFEKDWKMLLRLSLAVLFFFLVTLPFTGFGIWSNYVTEILPRLSVNEINNPFSAHSQTVTTFLRNFLVHDDLLNPKSPHDNPALFYWMNAAVVLFFLVTAGLVSLSENITAFAKFSFWIFAAMMSSGYGSVYGMLLLVFPLIGAWDDAKGKMWQLLILAALLTVVALPMDAHELAPFGIRFIRLWFLLAAFTVVLLMLRPQLRFHPLLFLPVLFIAAKSFFIQPDDKSEYLLDHEVNLLTGDYSWENDTLSLRTAIAFTDSFDPGPEKIYLPGNAKADSRVMLKSNQVFFGEQQLTFTNDRKKKPMLASDGTVVYLSDKNRGVGFYTLRKLPVHK